MSRIWNFSAGPAALPEAVLRVAQAELTDWHGVGAGIMEMSHRGKYFTQVIREAEADLRALLAIPEHYKVLFLQGGATLQFSQIPFNLLHERSADYLVTGAWSKKAFVEAGKLAWVGRTRLAASVEDPGAPAGGFTRLPTPQSLQLDRRAAYLHLCGNETIHGVEIHDDAWLANVLPPDVPLIADMSSHLLSRPMEVERYGLIYAGAQKNVGPAGLTLVIVREDLIGHAAPGVPALLDYKTEAENDSMLNTPATFSIYMAGLVFKWLRELGGLSRMAQINREKAALVYAAIDESEGFYRNPVDHACRSRMNIPFTLARPELEAKFLQASEEAGFMGLKGHKSVGGIRASLYNAMPLEGARALVGFMRDFAVAHHE
ncbi:MAG: 3-phosphoserine/phosphohydroxythreonine transaminase [Zoogloeaceae bacterium]|jgi:phosphoserine aminotransferase|nr:3-phosphoserine/phosphohydroxythreonine transaminase [Zoogloeaceae bacterium]